MEQIYGQLKHAREWVRNSAAIIRLVFAVQKYQKHHLLWDEQEAWTREAMEIAEEADLAEDIAKLNNNLAGLYESQRRYDEAETLYLKALQVREQILDENHPDTTYTYHGLGWVYKGQRRYKEAETLFLKALQVREHVFGKSHLFTAYYYNNLALFYQNQERYKEAEALFLKARKIVEQNLGKAHPDTVVIRRNYGRLLDVMRPKRPRPWWRFW